MGSRHLLKLAALFAAFLLLNLCVDAASAAMADDDGNPIRWSLDLLTDPAPGALLEAVLQFASFLLGRGRLAVPGRAQAGSLVLLAVIVVAGKLIDARMASFGIGVPDPMANLVHYSIVGWLVFNVVVPCGFGVWCRFIARAGRGA